MGGPAEASHGLVNCSCRPRSKEEKYLFDATPDIREQLYELHQSAPDGEYVLDGVFLTHAHMGHYTGLMHFGRESAGTHGVPVYAMPRMKGLP